MSCKYCTRKPVFDETGYCWDWDNADFIDSNGLTALKIGVDENGKLIMYGSDHGFACYYPKYCPECGRRLRFDMDSIDEMYKNLRKCYECTIPQSCVDCPYNGAKRDILQYLEKQIGKEQNPE